MISETCPSCGSEDPVELDTYKRVWLCCSSCGEARAKQKKRYSLSFLPSAEFKTNVKLNQENIYDYFIKPDHIAWSEKEGKEFITNYLLPSGLDVTKKSIIDISGGNGYFIKQLENLGAAVTLTEINKKTIEYARTQHGFETFEFDINEHDLYQVTGQKFDVVFARACLMFARDIDAFVLNIKKSLNTSGLVMINHSVIPTLGVMLRTQLDEHSYFVLRQPESVINAFEKKGFELIHRADETDSSLYVYDHDLRLKRRLLYQFYEFKALRKLAANRKFALPARDRRRSTLVFGLK